MAGPRKRTTSSGRNSVKDFVTVAFAEDLELARQHKQILEENGIHAVVRQADANTGQNPGIPVMVREEDLDQAHDLIASNASFEEFFDLFFQNADWEDEDMDEDSLFI